MKKTYKLLIGALVLVLLVVCILLIYNSTKADTENSKNYISFSVKSESKDDDAMKILTYEYSLENEKAQLMATLPFNSQYSLSVYDKENKCVYYSYRDETQCDQLYRYDIENQKSTKLTEDLFAINYIIPVDDSVYLGTVYKDRREVTLLKYENGKLSSLLDDDDLFVQNMSYNPDTQKIVFNTYSNSEAEKRFAEYNDDPDHLLTGKNTIWTLDVTNKDNLPQKVKVVGEGDMGYIISDEKDRIYYYRDGKHYILDDDIKQNLTFDELDIYEPIYIKGEDVFFEKGYNQLVKYNLKTKKSIVLYTENAEKAEIDNAIILY